MHLSHIVDASGGAELESRMRARCARNMIRELSPLLTTREASLKLKGKIYNACVRRDNETWPMKGEAMQHLELKE